MHSRPRRSRDRAKSKKRNIKSLSCKIWKDFPSSLGLLALLIKLSKKINLKKNVFL